jgi:hypothetical protein
VKESHLRTPENKAAIQVYQEKTRAELSRREDDVIRVHGARETDQYRNVGAFLVPAAFHLTSLREDAPPAQDAAPAAHPTEKMQLTDEQRSGVREPSP